MNTAADTQSPIIFECAGDCPCCDRPAVFRARHEWLRDNLLCEHCRCIPRERALMLTIERWYPAWRSLRIHESSPGHRGASIKLRDRCKHYTGTHFHPDIPRGRPLPGTRWTCEDLERQTFPDASFDLVISQDVFEHVLDPAAAFREVARTLRPGGAHIFTTPLVNKHRPSQVWADRGPDGRIVHHHTPEYHGNPIDAKGSLVTMHWGYDITEHIHAACGLPTTIVQIDDLSHGIRAEYIEVCVTRRPSLFPAGLDRSPAGRSGVMRSDPPSRPPHDPPIPQARTVSRYETAPAGSTLRDLFRHSTDEEWLWALTEGRATHPRLRELLPDLPTDDVQSNYTGRSSTDAFVQAVAAETEFLRVARELGLDTERPDFRMIDMGCGWGRITQTFLRDFRPEQIEGIDVTDRAVEICRSTRLPCRVHRVSDMPPTDLPASSVDLIVAFSVFSHLSERSHLAWVAEASRLLRPGGVLAVTTRAPSFIRVAERYRSMGDAMPKFARTTACSFTDAKAWLARYDRGEFCFDAPHMSSESGEAFYGQAIVPAAYAERAWAPHFPTVRFVSEEDHGKFDQSIIAGRKAL